MTTQWFYRKNGRELGPIDGAALKQLVLAGNLLANDVVRRIDMKDWIEANRIQGLFDGVGTVSQGRTTPKIAVVKPSKLPPPLPPQFESEKAPQKESAMFPPLDNVANSERAHLGFGRYFIQHFTKTRWPGFWGVTFGLLLAILISWFKPYIGIRGIFGFVIAILFLTTVSFIVYFYQRIHSYFFLKQRSVHRNAKSWFARWVYLGFLGLVPLTMVLLIEYYGPPNGFIRVIVTSFGYDVNNVKSIKDGPANGRFFGGWGGNSVATLRKEMMDTAKRMEGQFGRGVLEAWVKSLESGSAPWSMLDDHVRFGLGGSNYTPETIAAYERWRTAKIAEDAKKR